MILNATKRTQLKKEVQKLRQDNKIPAVVYGGSDVENKTISFRATEFEKLFQEIGTSTLFDLKIDDAEPFKVLVHDWQSDPLTGKIIHADLYQVNMSKKLTAMVKLNFIGESPAVKAFGGMLNVGLHEIEIECLPGDLIGHIDVDLGQLKELDDVVFVKDLKLPEGVEVLTGEDEAVASIVVIKEEAERPVQAAEGAGETKPEGASEEKKEEGEKK